MKKAPINIATGVVAVIVATEYALIRNTLTTNITKEDLKPTF